MSLGVTRRELQWTNLVIPTPVSCSCLCQQGQESYKRRSSPLLHCLLSKGYDIFFLEAKWILQKAILTQVTLKVSQKNVSRVDEVTSS